MDVNKIKDLETARRRGWIIYLLNESNPKPLELSSLVHLLDSLNFPMTPRGLAKDLSFLRGAKLILIAEHELSLADATKALNRYAELGDEDGLVVSLTNFGLNWHEGRGEVGGVMRIR